MHVHNCTYITNYIRVILFDVRVTDTGAASYVGRSADAVLASAEQEKKRKYLLAVETP